MTEDIFWNIFKKGDVVTLKEPMWRHFPQHTKCNFKIAEDVTGASIKVKCIEHGIEYYIDWFRLEKVD